MLDWLSTLPPLAVYGMLALLAALENVVPPVPADTAVALGAFLTHRGVTTLSTVYFVTLGANVAGAVTVYWMARRYGRRLFATRVGRRLLSPSALATIEREYLRFGSLGIFFGRFLPGIRAVVPPFAGLANLGAVRALLPMALASAIWYGAIALIGAAIGAEWSRISAAIASLNRTLAIVSGLVALAAVIIVVIRARRRRRGRLWSAFERALRAVAPAPEAGADQLRLAALALLEVAYADPSLGADERQAIATDLRDRWLPEGGVAGTPVASAEWNGVGERLAARFGRERRRALVERLWLVAMSGPGSEEARSRVLRSASALLGLSEAEAQEVALQAQAREPATP